MPTWACDAHRSNSSWQGPFSAAKEYWAYSIEKVNDSYWVKFKKNGKQSQHWSRLEAEAYAEGEILDQALFNSGMSLDYEKSKERNKIVKLFKEHYVKSKGAVSASKTWANRGMNLK